ncbi:MAG TPA: hypothetical protein VGN82_20545 [Bosea sp. (in: a-proteobacteria)]|uniref:hypothetical protein n=1 Tax=Bosea sp. (in: a-proteobacteria) TaxID=1871050 RepID=UPI002E0E7216|nr:hypothetical protein [Bosea sp. (in: a-proteobacteria)]
MNTIFPGIVAQASCNRCSTSPASAPARPPTPAELAGDDSGENAVKKERRSAATDIVEFLTLNARLQQPRSGF